MNNKGFAITTILYGILVLFLMLLVSMLGLFATYNDRLQMLIENNNGTRDIINTPKYVEIESNNTGIFEFVGGRSYEFVVGNTGTYKLEVWGAQGGNANNYRGGYGGYSVGIVTLTSGTKLYINVGGQGASGHPSVNRLGGFNGGGKVSSGTSDIQKRYVAGGGGATHIAKFSGELSTLSSKVDDILIVAGGGGGGYEHTNGGLLVGEGGDAGGYIGSDGKGNRYYGKGGTQTESGYAYNNTSKGKGGFGYGGNASSYGGAGGGGFYGGGGSFKTDNYNNNSSGGGGSGYIGNSLLSNKVMYCYKCLESTDVDTKTVSTENVSENATANYAKMGDGFARIQFLD